jgi:hypothetical protein
MKKKATEDQKQERKQPRLSLNRETILVLTNPALLELVQGGVGATTSTTATLCVNGE